jgi:hypothetical protein
MRQIADWNARDLLEVVGAKSLDLVQPADRDVGELPASCPYFSCSKAISMAP